MTLFQNEQTSILDLQEQSVFELFEERKEKKQLFLKNETPCKYGAIISKSSLNFFVETTKRGSELEMMLVCPVIDETPLTVNVQLNLKHSDCKVALHLLALVFRNAKTTLNASIYMDSKLENTDARLLEETVVLSPQVQLKSLPILDIHAKNIQASHGAKIYRLDEEHLFYLQTKGLPYKQAQGLLLSSYTERLFEGISLAEEEKWKLISDFLTFEF